MVHVDLVRICFGAYFFFRDYLRFFNLFTFEAPKNDHKETPTMLLETLLQETQQESPITGRKEHQEYYYRGNCKDNNKW